MKCINFANLTKKNGRIRNRRPFGRRFFLFAPSWCLDGARHGVLHPCHLCAFPGASTASGMEYCHHATFAPSLVPLWHQAWSIATVPPLRPVWCLTPSHYTHYSISQILELLQRCPLLAARYRPYKISRRLGTCE